MLNHSLLPPKHVVVHRDDRVLAVEREHGRALVVTASRVGKDEVAGLRLEKVAQAGVELDEEVHECRELGVRSGQAGLRYGQLVTCKKMVKR